jgi:hypothetical protein
LAQRDAKEMERTTKKPPPRETQVHVVWTSAEEQAASKETLDKVPLLQELLPFPNQGRVFIGFPTHQTTGITAHMAAHVIPTVQSTQFIYST